MRRPREVFVLYVNCYAKMPRRVTDLIRLRQIPQSAIFGFNGRVIFNKAPGMTGTAMMSP